MKSSQAFYFALLLLFISAVSCKKDKEPSPAPEPVKEDTLTTGWTKKIVSTTSDILDVVFYDNLTGYSASSDKSVYKSSDGGVTWANVYTASVPFVNISMSSSSHAIFVGNTGRVLYTKNGGNNFDSLALADTDLFDVFCVNSNIVYSVGQFFWKSTDGGSTWTKVATFNNRAKSIWFFDSLNGWVGGDFGLKKTNDGGLTWQPVSLSPLTFSSVYSIQFIDNNTGFISTGDFIAKTVNAGSSWTLIKNLENGLFHDLHFLNTSIGYVTDGRLLLKTTDGGTTWQPVIRLGDDYFIETHFTDISHGWAGTAKGKVFRYNQ